MIGLSSESAVTLKGKCLISPWVPDSENLRPIKRLASKIVFSGLLPAWFFADCPINRSDSVNDKPGLRCVWLLDNVPLYEGCNRSFSWDEYQGEDYRAELTLEVIDDDGEYSTMNVILIHPNEVQALPIVLIVPAISLIFLIYATINRFKSNNELEIPKWQSWNFYHFVIFPIPQK